MATEYLKVVPTVNPSRLRSATQTCSAATVIDTLGSEVYFAMDGETTA